MGYMTKQNFFCQILYTLNFYMPFFMVKDFIEHETYSYQFCTCKSYAYPNTNMIGSWGK